MNSLKLNGLFFAFLLTFCGVQAQKSIKDSTISFAHISIVYSANAPGGDLADRYGFANQIGGSVGYKLRKNWMLNTGVRFIFGGYALVSTGLLWLIGATIHTRRGQRRAVVQGGLLLVLTIAALLTVWLQRRFFSYHFMVAVPWSTSPITIPSWTTGRRLAWTSALYTKWRVRSGSCG